MSSLPTDVAVAVVVVLIPIFADVDVINEKCSPLAQLFFSLRFSFSFNLQLTGGGTIRLILSQFYRAHTGLIPMICGFLCNQRLGLWVFCGFCGSEWRVKKILRVTYRMGFLSPSNAPSLRRLVHGSSRYIDIYVDRCQNIYVCISICR